MPPFAHRDFIVLPTQLPQFCVLQVTIVLWVQQIQILAFLEHIALRVAHLRIYVHWDTWPRRKLMVPMVMSRMQLVIYRVWPLLVHRVNQAITEMIQNGLRAMLAHLGMYSWEQQLLLPQPTLQHSMDTFVRLGAIALQVHLNHWNVQLGRISHCKVNSIAPRAYCALLVPIKVPLGRVRVFRVLQVLPLMLELQFAIALARIVLSSQMMVGAFANLDLNLWTAI